MTELKQENKISFKTLDKFKKNPQEKNNKENFIHKKTTSNNKSLFLVQQVNDINKAETNISRTSHTNNTSNENISQEKSSITKEYNCEKEGATILENKVKDNFNNNNNKVGKTQQMLNIQKETIINANTNINSDNLKSDINNDMMMRNNPYIFNTNIQNSNIVENNINIQRNNYYNYHNYINNSNSNIIMSNNINYEYNNSNNNINNKNMPENIQNKRSLRGHSAQPNIHHLLENAIIKKEFQEPKRKVILKNDLPPSYGMIDAIDPAKNNSSFQKIINIDESDSFDDEDYESDFSQEFEEDDEDDEDYNLSNRDINWINKRKKDKDKEYSMFNNLYKKKEIDNPLYSELSELIKNFGFDKVIEYIFNNRTEKLNIKENKENKENKDFQLNKNEDENKDKDNEELKEKREEENIKSEEKNENKETNGIKEQKIEPDVDLTKKTNELLSKATKDDINILLIKILSDNFTENQLKLYEFISKKRSKYDLNFMTPIEIKDRDERFQKRSRSVFYNNNNIEKIREKRKHTKRPSPPFYYGKHYYRKNGKIFCYVPKAKTVSFNRYTLYCLYRGSKEKCMAKIVVHQNGKDITFIGNHICKPKMTLEDFYKKYPNVKNTEWTHIQFAFRNQKLIIMNQM